MSMFSNIDAEHHRGIIKRIIKREIKKLPSSSNTFPISTTVIMTVQEVREILQRILKECEQEIQE